MADIVDQLLKNEEQAKLDFAMLCKPSFESPASAIDQSQFSAGKLWLLAGYVMMKGLRSKAGVIGSIAALLVVGLIIALAMLATPEEPGDEIVVKPLDKGPDNIVSSVTLATLVDVDRPEWGQRMQPGDNGFIAGHYRLTEGAVRLELADGARVKLTAPVDFQITGRNEIGISFGELVASVPSQAIGFRVHTPAGDVVDLGTTFGVEVRDDQTTEVQVVEGLIRVAARGNTGELGDFQVLTTMQAAWLDKVEGRVATIPAEASRFTMDYVLKIDLVDIVAGGDGAGHARKRGLNPGTGVATDMPLSGTVIDRNVASPRRYQTVPHNRFIDGVFIPHRANGIQIDSSGNNADGFTISRSDSYQIIWAGGVLPGVESRELLASIAKYYPNVDPDRAPFLYMIPNKGITFDLDELRSAHDLTGKLRFESTLQNLSLNHSHATGSTPKADIVCFLDGLQVYQNIDMTPEVGGVEVAFEVPADARFLTLVVTDSGDRIRRDWVTLYRPMIRQATNTVRQVP